MAERKKTLRESILYAERKRIGRLAKNNKLTSEKDLQNTEAGYKAHPRNKKEVNELGRAIGHKAETGEDLDDHPFVVFDEQPNYFKKKKPPRSIREAQDS